MLIIHVKFLHACRWSAFDSMILNNMKKRFAFVMGFGRELDRATARRLGMAGVKDANNYTHDDATMVKPKPAYAINADALMTRHAFLPDHQ